MRTFSLGIGHLPLRLAQEFISASIQAVIASVSNPRCKVS
jgi:hypothetical protein